MKVSETMVQPVVVVREDTSLEEVARLMLEHGIGSAPVVDEHGGLCGIITESDFTGKERGVPFSLLRMPQVFGEWVSREGIEAIHEEARTMTARCIMSAPVVTASPEDEVADVVIRLIRHDINRLPVVRDGTPIGMVNRHDLLRLMVPEERPR